MDIQAETLHSEAVVADSHSPIWDEFVRLKLETGEERVFDLIYAPRLHKGGINVVNIVVGGDHTTKVINSDSDLPLWSALSRIDLLLKEEEEGAHSFVLCRTDQDIDTALTTGRIAVLLKIAGGRPLEGKPNLNLIGNLRNLYRLGVRSVQLTSNGRNHIADGVAQAQTKGGLTYFGRQVLQEMDRLGMVIDVAQLSEYGFRHVKELTGSPLLDSHSNAAAVCDHPRNLSDERIRAMAENDGVICLSFLAALVNTGSERPTVYDLVKHVDHIAELVGTDHIGLGPDFSGLDSLVPISRVERHPGWVEGIYYGIRESDYIEGPNKATKLNLVTQALLKHGYPDEDVRKILGGNFVRLYKQVLS